MSKTKLGVCDCVIRKGISCHKLVSVVPSVHCSTPTAPLTCLVLGLLSQSPWIIFVGFGSISFKGTLWLRDKRAALPTSVVLLSFPSDEAVCRHTDIPWGIFCFNDCSRNQVHLHVIQFVSLTPFVFDSVSQVSQRLPEDHSQLCINPKGRPVEAPPTSANAADLPMVLLFF